MESCCALQENSRNSPYMAHDVLCTENEVIPKLPLDSKMQIDVQANNSRYSESGILFNVSQEVSSENEIYEQKQLPSEPSPVVNGDLENKSLVHNNTDEVFLKSNLNLTIKGDENGVSDLDSSTGVGKAASSGYCTDTSEKEDESIAHKVTKPLCSRDSPAPSTSSAASEEVQAANTSVQTRSRGTRRTYSLRSRSKRSSTQVADSPRPPSPEEDLLPFDIDQLLHRDYEPVTSEEIYLRKLIQQLDSTYTKAVVLLTRLEVDSALWRKYLSK